MSDEQIDHDTQDAADKARERDDNAALSLVGAVVGDFYVKDRIKPGKRWRYVAHNTKNGRDVFLQGYELVRAVRQTVTNGGVVIMPSAPWRDEQGSNNGMVVAK